MGAIAEFAYIVTNTGNVRLRNIAVVADPGATVTCPSGNPIPELAPGDQETCSAQRTVVAGRYANLGSVNATAITGATVSDSDPSHHLGVPSFDPDLGIDIEKAPIRDAIVNVANPHVKILFRP